MTQSTARPSCAVPARPSRRRRLGGAGAGTALALIAGCAVCCAGPLLAGLGALTAGTALAALWVPALAGLALVAGSALAILAWRRHVRASRTSGAQSGFVAAYPVPRVDPAQRQGAPADAGQVRR
jgi:mercuric ion transport protein